MNYKSEFGIMRILISLNDVQNVYFKVFGLKKISFAKVPG